MCSTHLNQLLIIVEIAPGRDASHDPLRLRGVDDSFLGAAILPEEMLMETRGDRGKEREGPAPKAHQTKNGIM